MNLGAIDALFDGAAPSEDAVRRATATAVEQASSRPDGPSLVMLYVYACSLAKWERSIDYERIRTVLRGVRPAAPAGPRHGRISEHAQLLDHAMGAENAVQCSCPVALAHRSANVKAQLDAAEGGDGPPDGVAGVLSVDRDAQYTYHQALEVIGREVESFLMKGYPADSDLDVAIAAAERAAASDELRDDVYASELQAHRATLEALRDAARHPYLVIDEGRIVYVYPFAFAPGRAESGTPEAVAVDDIRDSVPRWTLGGHRLSAADVSDLELTDVWEHPDALGRSFSGLRVRLPEIGLVTTAGESQTLAAEVRISSLGNNYLRIVRPLDDTDPHTLNQALRRASECMGEETVELGGWQDIRRLPELAKRVIGAVAEGVGVPTIGDPSANFHVVVAARSMSVRGPGGARRVRSLADVRGATGGSLLLNPIRGVAAALEEWVQYPTPDLPDLLGAAAREGDFAIRTDNTTVLYRPDSPDWAHAAYEEIAEFTASVPPLLTSWERAVSEMGSSVEDRLDQLTKTHDRARLREVLDMEIRLRREHARIRTEQANLHSPTLVRERIYRTFMDNLWTAAGLSDLETDLTRQLEYTGSLLERLGSVEAMIEEERKDRVDRYVELGLVVLAATSLTQLFSWMSDTYAADGAVIHGIEAAVLIALAVLLGFMVLRKRGGP